MNSKLAENHTITISAPRDYLFDNIRAILIILVVWGHLLTSMADDNNLIRMIYFYLFFFHMPAMTFISGYFSKNVEKSRNKAFTTLLVPYLILNVCDYLYRMLILNEDYFSFRFFRPLWGLWYLLALFLWKFLLKDIIRIRFILPLSFLLALVSGFTKESAEYLAIGRVINFLPFFLLGFYLNKEHVKKIRQIPKAISVFILAATGAISYYVVKKDIFGMEVLYMRKEYPQDAELENMLFRLLVYIVALAMTFAVINLASSKRNILSMIGTTTITIYVLHILTIPALEKFEILKNHPYYYIIYSILATMLLTFIFSRPIVKRLYDAFFDKITGLFIRDDKVANQEASKQKLVG